MRSLWTYTLALVLSVTLLGCPDNTENPQPGDLDAIANFSADVTSGPAPLPVAFSNLSRNARSFQWNFGESPNSLEHGMENPQHTYHVPGVYTVGLTVSSTNFGGLGDSETKVN